MLRRESKPVLISTRRFETATSVASRRIMPDAIRTTAPSKASAPQPEWD
jgi:hypothetical protein